MYSVDRNVIDRTGLMRISAVVQILLSHLVRVEQTVIATQVWVLSYEPDMQIPTTDVTSAHVRRFQIL